MTRRPKILLAHPGTQYSYHLARELNRHGCLQWFQTTLAFSDQSLTGSILRSCANWFGFERHIENRIVHGVQRDRLACMPRLEIAAIIRAKLGGSNLNVLHCRNVRFQQRINDSQLDEADGVIGFDTSSYILARRTVAKRKPFILDRSIGHPKTFKRVCEDICHRFPEWAGTYEQKPKAWIQEEDEEHDTASLIVVPSRFVASTLETEGISTRKIRINAYGTDTFRFRPAEVLSDGDRMIFLFVGSLTARKGLPLLLESWRRLKPRHAELWVVGAGQVPTFETRTSPASILWKGAISRNELPTIMQRADVFVFPSLFEGLAQVQIEAAASGLPVIGTTASGAEEVVTPGETGFVLHPGELDELTATLELCMEDKDLVRDMKTKCRAKAPDWDWRNYGMRWLAIIEEAITC